MENNEFKVLLPLLLMATAQNKIQWGVRDSSSFIVKLGNSSVGISMYYDNNTDTSFYSLIEYNSDNKDVVNFTFSDNDDEDKDSFNQLSQLYALVNDKVYKISATKMDILSSLQKIIGNEKNSEK